MTGGVPPLNRCFLPVPPSPPRQVIHGAGFLYDSSLLERPQGSASRGLDRRLWPYSLGDGVAQDCEE